MLNSFDQVGDFYLNVGTLRRNNFAIGSSFPPLKADVERLR